MIELTRAEFYTLETALETRAETMARYAETLVNPDSRAHYAVLADDARALLAKARRERARLFP